MQQPQSGRTGLFWVHYKRKADGQDFHERLTTGGLAKLLAQGGITLCSLEAADLYEKEAET